MKHPPEKNLVARIMSGVTPPPPVAVTLGGRIVAIDLDAGTIEANYIGSAGLLNPAGQVQGGMLSAMLDDLTASLVMATVTGDQFCVTLALNVSFLRPCATGVVFGRGRFLRRGRDVSFVFGELTQDGKTVATSTATLAVRTPFNPGGRAADGRAD